MTSFRFLFSNGVLLQGSEVPPVATFLETHPGAYTTTRTHNNASSILFWDRHMKRLTQSVKILSNSTPQLLSESNRTTNKLVIPSPIDSIPWKPAIRTLVDDSMRKVLPVALNERNGEEELAVTVLVSVNLENLGESDGVVDVERVKEAVGVHTHVGNYVPREFGVPENGANLAVVGRGRDAAAAKYSDWVRRRKSLEKLRPPSVTELLLSNDGDQILEGCLTNFFVVCRKDNNEAKGTSLLDSASTHSFELQTAPISDGVLTGVIRQLVVEACLSIDIPFREVAPTWSSNEMWEEAFVTNSLRVMEHVNTICMPNIWDLLESKTWREISWNKKSFKDAPGIITSTIQKEIMKKVVEEAFPIGYYV
ncbi:uncharacterized protein LOC111794909 isoform X1 [Cucurbita pepo subsp. pepo]|uniref:uncharacterized protein LOC111794909 isoform X1 n=1 Tax=Cucurbita pepo subsp. pepo TaxID=3664 RepID=UPI000C9D5275|nr:uncharacterized protein LOC111794909 isoform X1 [Cucurbita pepo subsp. pepo]